MEAVAIESAVQAWPSLSRQDRADVYALLARLLLGPEPALVRALAVAPPWPEPADRGTAEHWQALCAAAARCRPQDEFEALFVAAGTPPLNPYQSFYLSGCLMDKPLALLRDDLRALGLARTEGATELEDHLGVLCEAMHLLLAGEHEDAAQARFFERHLASWTHACLQDIRDAPAADFYATLAAFMQHFLAAEAAALQLELSIRGAEPPARALRMGALAT